MQRSIVFSLFALLFVVGSAALMAQVAPYYRNGRIVTGELPPERTGFTFCRLVYTSTYREPSGSGWNTDYPLADQNFMVRFSELTSGEITRQGEGDPHHALVRASDDALFQCPFLYASDAGTIGWDENDVARMREYFDKGGMLWADDFWGDLAWSRWVYQISRVLPEYEFVELSINHPIFSTFYTVEKIPQIPSIQHWRRSGGETSERGEETAVPRIWGLFDDRGRLLVLASHNTDIADGWEREGEDWEFFHLFSPYGYAVGINVALWSMTH